ncbi:SMP-30/gluconolactonase/LRE family protein [Bacteroidota bacterium]
MKQILIIALATILLISCKESKNYEIAYQLNEQDLIPEGITYSEKTECFYISSILKTKIVQINAITGEFEDFIPSTLINRRFVGMIVDNKRNQLWACGNIKIKDKTYSSVFKFDVENRKLIREYHFPDTAGQMVNDVVIDNEGNAYFTDSNNQHIYKISAKTDSIELFFESDEIKYPNGITLSPDNKYLYVAAYETGIRVIDIASRKIVNEPSQTIDSKGIDGLKRYKNSLIATQNYFDNTHDIRLVRYYLDETETKITHSEIIDMDNPFFDIPTTHVIVSDHLYSLATSSLGNVNWDKYEIKDPEKLCDIKILKYQL